MMILSLIAYNLVLLVALPALCLWALLRLLRGKSRAGFLQRFGILKKQMADAEAGGPERAPRIWIHACSVGEVSAVTPILKILRERFPEALIFLSTITPTGQTQARRNCKEADAFFYFPFDLLPCMWAAFRLIKPDLCVLTEKELWPNFLALCTIRQIPIVVVNGILSDRTFSRARWFGSFLRWLLGMVSFFSLQTEEYRRRLLQLGVAAEKIAVDGNTKFDQPMPEEGAEESLAEALGWTEGTIGFVAGSTHAGEEELVLHAFRKLKKKHPQVRLILAPRHPERAAEVIAAATSRGLECIRRSHLPLASTGQDCATSGTDAAVELNNKIVILDTIGELRLAYRLARAAFVGGSLVDHVGGHNPLEVTAEGLPVFFGPRMRSCRDIADLLLGAEVAHEISKSSELQAGWQRAISDADWRVQVRQKARQVMQKHSGGAARAAARVLHFLSEQTDSEVQGASTARAATSPPDSFSTAAIDAQLSGGKRYLLAIVLGAQTGLIAKIIRGLLAGASYLYRAGLAANLSLYRVGLLRKKRTDCPVISIGNLTLGGTGKTVAAAAICRWLLDRRLKPAVLSRGYGGDASIPRIVSQGGKPLLGPGEAGDEPFLLAASLPQALVLVGKDRRRSAEMALQLGADVLVLDDGFQYWKMTKDIEVVLIDALNPFGNERVLPGGLLREPLGALRRADAIWITHCDLVSGEQLNTLEKRLAELAGQARIERTIHKPAALRDFATGDGIGTWTLSRKKVIALSGLGNPYSFEEMLRKMGADVIPVRFPDHYKFSQEDIAKRVAEISDAHMIVTTAKDAVRLPPGLELKLPLRVLEISMAPMQSTATWGIDGLLNDTLGHLITPRRGN